MANETFGSVQDVYAKHSWLRNISGGDTVARKAVNAISNSGAIHAVWKFYQDQGGGQGFNAFRKSPTIPPGATALTSRAAAALTPTGGVPPGAQVTPETPGERVRRGIGVEQEAAGVDLGGAGVVVPSFPTEDPPPGFRWVFDRDLNRYVPQFAGLTAIQRAGQEEAERQREFKREEAKRGREGFAPTGEAPTDAFGRTATWNPRTGSYDFPPNFGQRPQDQPAPISPYQQEQLGLQQQQLQFQQEQAQQQVELQRQQEMARLAANPINWLQYAAFTGQEPVVQPWMMPLGFQQFGGQGGTATPQIAPQGQAPQGQTSQATTLGGQQLQVGQPLLPQGGTDFTQLAGQFRTPSAQLQARWGPTAQGQFLGLQRAATGASPQETQFRLGAGRAPAGRFQGFSRFR